MNTSEYFVSDAKQCLKYKFKLMKTIYFMLAVLLLASCDKNTELRKVSEKRCPVVAAITNEYGGVVELRSYIIHGHNFIGHFHGAPSDILVHDPDCLLCLLRNPEPCK